MFDPNQDPEDYFHEMLVEQQIIEAEKQEAIRFLREAEAIYIKTP